MHVEDPSLGWRQERLRLVAVRSSPFLGYSRPCHAKASTATWRWRGGAVSDEVLELAPQPEPSLPIYLAGEAFSRQQSWVEGALEAAQAVLERLLAPAPADSIAPLS